MNIKREQSRHEVLSTGMVVPEANRCVQCGICSYNCPSGIDVRKHSWDGRPIADSRCLTCGQCVARCPRGVLRFERLPVFEKGERDESPNSSNQPGAGRKLVAGATKQHGR